MSEEKIDTKLINMAKVGDADATSKLLQMFMPLIERRSRKFFLQGAEKEDLIQEALIGFIEAIRDYDEDKNDSFSHFLNLCVTRQMFETVKKFSRKKHLPLNSYISLDSSTYNDDEDSKKLYEIIMDDGKTPEEYLIYQEGLEILENNDGLLSKLENKVLELYMQNLSYDEIAEKLGKDYKAVDNALQRIKKKLYDRIKDYYQD